MNTNQKNQTKTILIRVSPAFLATLANAAKAIGVGKSQFLRDAVAEKIERQRAVRSKPQA